jgi:hypothetical protein
MDHKQPDWVITRVISFLAMLLVPDAAVSQSYHTFPCQSTGDEELLWLVTDEVVVTN